MRASRPSHAYPMSQLSSQKRISSVRSYPPTIRLSTHILPDNTARLATLSSVEPGLGIILGSAAATRPLFRSVLDKSRAWATARSQLPGREDSRSKHDAPDPPKKISEQFIRLNSIEGVRNKVPNLVVDGGRVVKECRK